MEREAIFRPSKEESYLAFAEAVDEWSGVEMKMKLFFCGINTPKDFAKSAMILNSIVGLKGQLAVMRAAAAADLHLIKNPDLAGEVERTIEDRQDGHDPKPHHP